MNIVPCYTIIASVVMPNMRAVACGAALASIHLLGDIWSPTLMGWAVDTFGQADSDGDDLRQGPDGFGRGPGSRSLAEIPKT